MRKIFIALTILVGLIILVACGGRYSNANERNQGIARQAVEIADEYFDGRITARQASDRMHNLPSFTRVNPTTATDIGLGNSFLSTTLAFSSLAGGRGTEAEALERRNNLASGLGMRRR